MTDTEKIVADARAQLAAAKAGNVIDRLQAVESVVLQLLDVLEHAPRTTKGRLQP